MAQFHLKHSIHGFRTTTSVVEANQDKENGWEEYNPSPEPVVESKMPSFLGGSSDIPENFPARQFLIDGGVTKWSELVVMDENDLTAIKGIGPATAREILEKLNS